MAWIFGIVGLLVGWTLAVWTSRRACEARIREVEANWAAKLAQGDQSFAARIRDHEARLEREKQQLEEEWSAKVSAREAGWRNRLEAKESELQTQLEDLDAKLADRQRAEAATRRIRPIDRLTDIDGIGRRTGELLAENEISTFSALANTSVERLHEVLEEAGGQFQNYDPEAWPVQARLAAEGRYDELETLKEWLQSR